MLVITKGFQLKRTHFSYLKPFKPMFEISVFKMCCFRFNYTSFYFFYAHYF